MDDREREARFVAREQRAIRENLEDFRDRYWPIYQEFGFTFQHGYEMYLMEERELIPVEEEKEPWQT